jgi:hypothetical protein
MRSLAPALVCLALAATSTHAQSGRTVPQPKSAASRQLTPAAVQNNPLALIQNFAVEDLQAALADAKAQTPPDTAAANCYTALLAVVQSNVANPLPAGPGIFQAL